MREKTGKIEINRIEKLIPVLRDDPGIVLAYLFGSYAAGNQSALSDVDIAILLAPNVSRAAYMQYRLNYLSLAAKIFQDDRVDVVILNAAPPLLAHQAIKGRLLFERSPEARVEYVVSAQSKYLDLKWFYAIDSNYMARRIKEGTFGQP